MIERKMAEKKLNKDYLIKHKKEIKSEKLDNLKSRILSKFKERQTDLVITNQDKENKEVRKLKEEQF